MKCLPCLVNVYFHHFVSPDYHLHNHLTIPGQSFHGSLRAQRSTSQISADAARLSPETKTHTDTRTTLLHDYVLCEALEDCTVV
jgi:hypothetical protein